MRDQPSDRHRPTSYGHARRLRREQTPAEVILWRLLRNRRLRGFKFRRQQPIGGYVADFFCAAGGVIVELDGESHFGREAHDQARQSALEQLGYTVVRFHNGQVYDESEAVVEAIWTACVAGVARRTHGRVDPGKPSPLEGEGGGASPPGEGKAPEARSPGGTVNQR